MSPGVESSSAHPSGSASMMASVPVRSPAENPSEESGTSGTQVSSPKKTPSSILTLFLRHMRSVVPVNDPGLGGLCLRARLNLDMASPCLFGPATGSMPHYRCRMRK